LGVLPFYLAGGGKRIMESLENMIFILDNVLNTNRKRHIAGGILLSVSMLFGGLALTVMTIKCEENNDE
jgi:hypothetical protein